MASLFYFYMLMTWLSLQWSYGIKELRWSFSHHFEMKDTGTISYFLDYKVISFDLGYYLPQRKKNKTHISRVSLIDCKLAIRSLDPKIMSHATVGNFVYLTITCPAFHMLCITFVSLFTYWLFFPCTNNQVCLLWCWLDRIPQLLLIHYWELLLIN